MRLTKSEAIRFLGLDEKVFENFFKNAGEFESLPRPNNAGFYFFEEKKLDEWKKSYESRVFTLTKNDYAKCMDFALAMHFRGYVLSDWGTGRQREFGQKLSNWIRGQLGEIGVQYLCRERLGFNIELDFDMHDEIVPQDVLSITKNRIKRTPVNNISIKASKPKSAYLVLSPNEVELKERKSDVYIFTRVELPDDHLLRIAPEEVRTLVKNQQHYKLYENLVPDFQPIPVEVAGFAYRKELDVVKSIPGQDFEGERYVKKSGELHRDVNEWKEVFKTDS
jgi:hypothetical protein